MPVKNNNGEDMLKSINREEVLKYLGYKGGALEEEYLNKIDLFSHMVMEKATPRCEWIEWGIYGSNPVHLQNSDIVLTGKSISEHLEGCESCVFFVATIGSEIDRLIRIKSVENMADAVILDACASVAIENVCDNMERYLEEKYLKEENLYITDRFSPGYGDFPIEMQKIFCDLTHSLKRIGLGCNSSYMLTPAKSVTAVIGISSTPRQKKITGCKNCFLKGNCEYKKRGVTCYE